ncbi:MAG: histidine-type phosphatase [Prevotella sp.]|nr:histidine-type phosphatase [Prevotella sp.]
MRKFFIQLAMISIALSIDAQDVRKEILSNYCLSASNYLAYPGPSQNKLTPAPKGYKPFYISHYGRHGSRYLIGDNEYDKPLQILSEADKNGKLTPLGKDVLERVRLLWKESYKRLGELTELGAQQHKDIAKRMFERFPEVFSGNVHIDAKSTVVIRCILSMENELQQFLLLNPKLDISHDASYHDMYYMNLDDRKLSSEKMPDGVKEQYNAYRKAHVDYSRLINSLFNDSEYVRRNVSKEDFGYRLFKLASNLQSSELRKSITLYDIFTPEELYVNWQMENVRWYIEYGACPLNGGKQPFSQRNLLRRIIEQADSCMALPNPGVTLRFGHETMVLPLTCLLGINGYDKQIEKFDDVEKEGWINYRIFPMGANIQFIFYRRNASDKDIIVKVLLNENEASLPVKTDCAPYYKWTEVRNFYLSKLDSYR